MDAGTLHAVAVVVAAKHSVRTTDVALQPHAGSQYRDAAVVAAQLLVVLSKWLQLPLSPVPIVSHPNWAVLSIVAYSAGAPQMLSQKACMLAISRHCPSVRACLPSESSSRSAGLMLSCT